jgi:hypothetical protein
LNRLSETQGGDTSNSVESDDEKSGDIEHNATNSIQRDTSTVHANRTKAFKPTVDFDLAKEQRLDADIRPLIEALETSEIMPEWSTFLKCSEDTKNLLAQWPLLSMNNGVLCRRWVDNQQNTRWLQSVIL